MGLITWLNKVTLNVSPEADINVVRSADMNQIKTEVNANSSQGAANEIQISDGSNTPKANSKVFVEPSTAVITLGDSGLAGDRGLEAEGSSASVNFIIGAKGPDGEAQVRNNSFILKAATIVGSTLTDSSSIAINLQEADLGAFDLSTVEAAITLTFSNVVKRGDYNVSILKTNAADTVITLAGTSLDFYGYNNADLDTSAVITLSGAAGDKFEISLLARTATSLGVAVAQNGN